MEDFWSLLMAAFVEGYPKRSGLNFGVFEFVCRGWERK